MISPAIVHNTFCCLIKPEVIFWPFCIIIYYGAIYDMWLVTIIFSSIILFVNFSISVLIGAVILPLWLFSIYENNTIPGGIYLLLLLPGLIKNFYKVFKLIKSKFLYSISNLQRSKLINKDQFLKIYWIFILNLLFLYY